MTQTTPTTAAEVAALSQADHHKAIDLLSQTMAAKMQIGQPYYEEELYQMAFSNGSHARYDYIVDSMILLPALRQIATARNLGLNVYAWTLKK